MRVFKRSVIDRHTGKRKPTAKFYIEFTNQATELRCRLPAFTDKATSEAFGRKLEQLSAYVASGQQPPADLRRWLDSLSFRCSVGYLRLL